MTMMTIGYETGTIKSKMKQSEVEVAYPLDFEVSAPLATRQTRRCNGRLAALTAPRRTDVRLLFVRSGRRLLSLRTAAHGLQLLLQIVG